MDKYICSVCGYIYDPDEEDAAFDDFPDDRICPICGTIKDQFDKKV